MKQNKITKITKSCNIEGKLIKEGAVLSLLEAELQEAFGSGKAAMVAEKLGNILGRKIGYKINMSDVPLNYSNNYGQFSGYLGAVSNGLFIKINFALAGSDSIESFDIYLDGISDAPTYTVETKGMNIIQIVDLMVSELVDDGEVSESLLEQVKIKEKGVITDSNDVVSVIDKFVKEDRSRIKDLQSKAVPDIFNGVWGDWVNDKPNYQIKYYLFAKALKSYLIQNGMTNKTYKPRKKGTTEREVVDPTLANQFDEILDAMTWQDKFELLKGSIKAVVDGDIQALFLFGDPGSGKSFTTINELDNLGVAYKLYKGGVKGMDELIRIMYNNRDNTLLVLDDFDSALKQKDSANIMKAALENIPVRTITYADVSRGKNMEDVPQKFEFSSGIIFVSNERKLNSAIASRALTLEITLSNDEVLDKIAATLKNYRPEINLGVKQQALDYLHEISKGVRTVDYRSLDKVLVAMKVMPNNWKKAALMFIKALD